MAKLAGKSALVTGGNSGIGLAIARLFVAEGARVAICGRDPRTLAAAGEELGPNAIALRADLSQADQRHAMFEAIAERLGGLDIVIANAALVTHASVEQTTPEMFAQVMATNVAGVFFLVQEALSMLRDGGAIVLIGSVLADLGRPGFAAYAASKAAVRSLARTLAAELAPRRIRVNVVTPGVVMTPLWERGGEAALTALERWVAAGVAMRRAGRPEEIAHAVLFVASDDASYVQGAELLVDGGVKELMGGAPAFRFT
ncbi:MAG TPA: glucose 1-dehydrogenase [Candidatus Binataceae bacterium]|nr:glucose 1-dehydrogenase [Candidatus Binataceae bacterium]